MEKAQEEEELSPLAQNFLSQIRIARRHQPPRLDWMPPGYPGPDLFLNPKILIDLASLLRDSSKTQSPGHRKKIERFLNQYPFLPLILNRLLLGENSSSFAVDILVAINQPNSDAVLINFALSQVGSKSARMKAILDLLQTGRYSGPKVIRIWDETMGEWREVILSTQRIGEIPIKVQPKTMSLIEKAHRSKNPQDAVSLLRKAVEFEPTCAQAIFNLGVMLTQIGEQEEGENLIYQSVVVDPTYTFGHASIALTEMEDENEQAALEHLQFVNQAEVITPETAVIANLAQSMIALRKRDLKGARNYLNIAAELNPDHRLLKEFQARIERAEAFGFILEYQRKSAARGHRKLLDAPITGETGLHACLETNTKDMLVGSAQFLHTSSAGKKGELASRLAKNLLDAEFLREILEEDLNEKECEALKWILNGGGIQPWEDFARKYSYDQSESLFWIYHEPESVAGRLRRSGLLFSGKLEGQRVIFIPADVRELLRELLN